MVYASFDGREIVKALRPMGYRLIGREGSHVKLRYEHPETDEVRVVTVPLTDSDQISQDTYRSIPNGAVPTTLRRGVGGSATFFD